VRATTKHRVKNFKSQIKKLITTKKKL